MENKINSAVKKEIRKQVKINGSHINTVKQAILVQFPSINFAEFYEFTKNEFSKKYASVKASIKASIRF